MCPKLFLLFTIYENKLNLHYKIYFECSGIFFFKINWINYKLTKKVIVWDIIYF